MTPERWEQIHDVLQKALELAPGERSAFLAQACSSDPSLRQEVDTLLASSDDVRSSFLLQFSGPRVTLMPGTKLGEYEVKSLLGSGGMGEVYRARDARLGRDVAIKVLPASLTANSERLRRFEQEARAAAALNHPNILSVFQMGIYEGAPYLVSELLEGETLREPIRRGRLAVRKAIDYAVQIARGLAAAHEKGIVHRDLKPENLFVTKDGRVKILDFGLAKLVQAQPRFEHSAPTVGGETEPGVVMGTVGYMSPEQVRGQVADHRTDIFSFGTILYEMLTGQRAFQKATSADTMSAILNEDPPTISQVTTNIAPGLQRLVQRCLEKNPEQRFQSASDLAFALDALSESSGYVSASSPSGRSFSDRPGTAWTRLFHSRQAWIIGSAAIVVAALIAGIIYHRSPQTRTLTDKDTIVLADFTNTTGDSVFDDTLKQGLAVQLEQSPFLNILPDQKVQDTLKLMGRAPGERLTPEMARDLCQRTGSTAYVGGAVASVGSQYAITLNLVNCHTGDSLAHEQATATGKDRVLKALNEAATELRTKAGESLVSVEKFDAPIEQATTPSLEALKAYSLGMRVRSDKGDLEAIPFFKQAIEKDLDFASAYASLGSCYANSGETELGIQLERKAYELRDRASERERLRISNMFFFNEGAMQKALDAAKLWVEEYPRDKLAHRDLGNTYSVMGEDDSAIAEYEAAIRLDPEAGDQYPELMSAYVRLDRLSEAKATYQKAVARNLDNPDLHYSRYYVAFLEDDTAEMERQMSWAAGKPGQKEFLALAMFREEFHGHLEKARQLSQRTVDAVLQSDRKEAAAGYQLLLAGTELEFGNLERAHRGAMDVLAGRPSPTSEMSAAFILARAGDSTRAQALAADLEKRFPSDTQLRIHSYHLPLIRAAVELSHKNPAGVIELLPARPPFELRSDGGGDAVYIRGLAYLELREGENAAVEFLKILAHRSLVGLDSHYALAHLQLGRAYALQHETAKARKEYQDFLTLWKDADPGIPILKEAKAEYASLLGNV
jgi:serine/threonine protein kinase/tetratricopeptide (TPR) repeat protein